MHVSHTIYRAGQNQYWRSVENSQIQWTPNPEAAFHFSSAEQAAKILHSHRDKISRGEHLQIRPMIHPNDYGNEAPGLKEFYTGPEPE